MVDFQTVSLDNYQDRGLIRLNADLNDAPSAKIGEQFTSSVSAGVI